MYVCVCIRSRGIWQRREWVAEDPVSEGSRVQQGRKRGGRAARGPAAVSPLGFEQHPQLREQLALEPVSDAYALPGDFGLRQVS